MENEPRQHLSLSNYAFQIINEDIALFYETSFSGIINRILKNYDNTKASLSYVAKEAANQFDLIFDDINTNPEMKRKYIDQAIDEAKKSLYHFPKDISKKIRLQNSVYEELYNYNWPENKYNISPGSYIKAVLEDYSRKTFYEREQIVYRDYIETIQNSITNKRQLKISYTTASGIQNTFIIKPYRMSNKYETTYNYLIGTSVQEDSIATYRISRITNVKEIKQNGKIKDNKKIEKEISDKGIQFLSSGDCEKIIVEFTREGKRKYDTILHLRPQLLTNQSNNMQKGLDGETYYAHFYCTKYQALIYFLQFGSDAIIIEPTSLQKEIEDKFLAAYNSYKHHR